MCAYRMNYPLQRSPESSGHVSRDIGRRFVKFFPLYFIHLCRLWRMTAWNFIWRSHAGDVEYVKEIPSLFLSMCGKCRMPRVSMRVSSGAMDASRNFSRHIYVFLSGRKRFDSTLHTRIFESDEKPHRKAAPIWIIRLQNINRSTKLIAHSYRMFNIRYILTLRRQKRQRGTFKIERMFDLYIEQRKYRIARLHSQ